MFNAPEVTHEYNLLNDFLCASLLEDGIKASDANVNDTSTLRSGANVDADSAPSTTQPVPAQHLNKRYETAQMKVAPILNTFRVKNSTQSTSAQETFYMTAADPVGSDTPEERMNKLLDAKYKAGLLRPFNYVNGYRRLQQYMDHNLLPNSRQRILRQLDEFRPKFRERIQRLTDVELVLVEMWFERKLMEYDRIFASMAVPACCWRRTGEIFRGNEEMAQLIHVPIEKLRDVSLM